MSAARILVVDDEADIRGLLREILSEEGYDVDAAADAAQARASRARHEPDLVLLDIWMPDTDGISLLREWCADEVLSACPVVMMSGHGTVETAVEATRLGAFDFIEKPVSLAKLLRVVELALESGGSPQQAKVRNLLPSFVAPIGRSRAMQALRDRVERVASHDTSVLFLGEPGTGREAFARYLHSLSTRADGPFVVAVAGMLGDEDAASRLFGKDSDGEHVGGLLDEARGGTLFVNELGDLSTTAQKALLSALEAGEYTAVGDGGPRDLNVRIVSSAQTGFDKTPASAFRRDLLSLLNIITLRIPPLRDYAEDVPELLRYYVDRLVDAEHLDFRRFSVASQNRLRNYPWPGNVRELKNLVHRLLIMGNEEEISLEEIEDLLAAESPPDGPLVKQDLLALPLREAREQFERAYLQQQLILCRGKVGKLATRVGMERTHLYRKLRSLGIDFRQSATED
ncbi:MAG: sigma-54 dependent transcriptional regulator [Chromatiales bacterium]|jgi:DNA-binding NtrC family response regulator|nr:sigma-54 dependent transcriptional regulator [Chromatiales bacterium]